ncbi:MAG: hypothetical protein KME20_06040 [Kaiparowitsia implicata GSE-PSE-MK54-09C]|jgi:hypothetical protein|nr:hypothetical protein [Kaiparowitsia implicata GSE-PSE-MK54-09C]
MVKSSFYSAPLGLLLAGLALQSSCNAPREQTPVEAESPAPVAEGSPEAMPDSSPSPPSADVADSVLISADGIGAAQLGMTLGSLKQALPEAEFEAQAPFIVDFDAIAVRQNGVDQFHILYLAGETFTDADTIQGLFTTNPDYQTAEGVGAGTVIQQAEAAYGSVTLSYSTNNESREYARFEQHPSTNIAFGTGTVSGDSAAAAGVYSTPASEYNETPDYRDDAQLASVLVVCLVESCTPTAAE